MKRSKYSAGVSAKVIILILILAAGAAASLCLKEFLSRLIVTLVAFAAAVLYSVITAFTVRRRARVAGEVLKQYSDQIEKYVNAMMEPIAVAKKSGKILWCNAAFLALAGGECEGKNLYKLFPALAVPDKDKRMRIGDVAYLRQIIYGEFEGDEYVICQLIDTNNLTEASEVTKNVSAAIAFVQVDNYSELMREVGQKNQTMVNAQIEDILSVQAEQIKGCYQRCDKDKYMLVFERRYLSSLQQTKFSFLDEVKKIRVEGKSIIPTLSVGVGVGRDPAVANGNAAEALDLALGRGGDQAVIKDGADYKFYGGGVPINEKRTKVKVRTFAQALKNLMEQCSHVVIMGHRIPDLDCMGAAMGLLSCAAKAGKKANIVLNTSNPSIQGLVDEIRKDPYYNDLLVTGADAAGLLKEQGMLIVVDTQIPSFTIEPSLLQKTNTIVVIDHHVQGTNHIENPTLALLEPYASSAAEMVTETIEYFAEKMPVRPLEAEALLAGIMIDTKGFSFRTGARAFEAASYLRKLGADTTNVRHLFQDDLETFSARAGIVQNAQILPHGIAVSWCPDNVKNPQMLAAQAADALINIKGIQASFVLCKVDSIVYISGRSLGKINVQRILEKLGGGGHATMAGAQLHGVDKEKAQFDLTEAIDDYLANS